MEPANPAVLADWLAWLEQLHPKSIDLGLERVSKAAKKLQLQPFPHFTITVAGTNGKGSCVALLEAILSAQGYRVGTYTSPHLLNFNERIRLNQQFCSDEQLCDALQAVNQLRGDISLTYFEFTTLAALLIFKQTKLDAVILEVGLGGRLDAVNCVDADIAIISSIALDHTEWLGDTREAIGYEKAGIMRKGKPVVYGELDIPSSIVQQAKKLDAPLYCLGRDFHYQSTSQAWDWSNQQQQWQALPLPKLAVQNAATVLQAVNLLPNYLSVTQEAIIKGLQCANQPGRWQVLAEAVETILDVAHNPAAASWLAERLQAQPSQGRTFAVVAMLADKDSYHTLAPLIGLIAQWYVASLSVARGADSAKLVQDLEKLKAAKIKSCASVSMAYQLARADAKAGDRIIVLGSFYTVAEVLRAEGITHVEWR